MMNWIKRLFAKPKPLPVADNNLKEEFKRLNKTLIEFKEGMQRLQDKGDEVPIFICEVYGSDLSKSKYIEYTSLEKEENRVLFYFYDKRSDTSRLVAIVPNNMTIIEIT